MPAIAKTIYYMYSTIGNDSGGFQQKRVLMHIMRGETVRFHIDRTTLEELACSFEREADAAKVSEGV
jgi:hypothetical protein